MIIFIFFLTNAFRSTNSLLDLNKMMMTDKYCYCFRDLEDCRFTIIWLFLPLTFVGWAQKMFPYFRGKIFFFSLVLIVFITKNTFAFHFLNVYLSYAVFPSNQMDFQFFPLHSQFLFLREVLCFEYGILHRIFKKYSK